MKSSELKVGDRVVYRVGGNPEFCGGRVTEVSPSGEFVCFDCEKWRRAEQVMVAEVLAGDPPLSEKVVLNTTYGSNGIHGTNGNNGKSEVEDVNGAPAGTVEEVPKP